MKEVNIYLILLKFHCSILLFKIHRIVTTCLGSPPEQITFEYYDTYKQYQKIGPISPIDFYKQIVKPAFNIDDKVIFSKLIG